MPPTEAELSLTPPDWTRPAAVPTQLDHDAVLKMTAVVFSGAKIEFGTGIDPEIEDDEFFVVTVTTTGSIDELLLRDRQWHHLLWEVAPATGSCYRLLMDICVRG